MNWLVRSLIAGVISFAATNIDDIVILMLFFIQVNSRFRPRHIVAGQYLGFGVLIAASLPGFFGSLVIPKGWIGLLGFVPIALGVRQLLNPETNEVVQTLPSDSQSTANRLLALAMLPAQTYHVALITVANGGDNIGIYVPLFASSDPASLIVILSTFCLLVGVWCYVAYHLSRHAAIAPLLVRYGQAIVPFVLIALGVYILIESGSYQLL